MPLCKLTFHIIDDNDSAFGLLPQHTNYDDYDDEEDADNTDPEVHQCRRHNFDYDDDHVNEYDKDYDNDYDNANDTYDDNTDHDIHQCRRRAAEQLTFQSGTIYAQQYQGGR